MYNQIPSKIYLCEINEIADCYYFFFVMYRKVGIVLSNATVSYRHVKMSLEN